LTLTTTALYGSSSRRFGGCVWTPPPRGRPSFFVQHCVQLQSHWTHSWHTTAAKPAEWALSVGRLRLLPPRGICRESLSVPLARLRERCMQRPRCWLAPRNLS